MPDREATPTHSGFLELREELAGMREGYSFLDEKRLILASEILTQLERYASETTAFRADYAAATDALSAAAARHGLEGLSVYPSGPPVRADLQIGSRSVLGVIIHEAECRTDEQAPAPSAVDQSPEAEECRRRFRALIPRLARLATLAGNLERLRLEYRRTARRARALEDVLLPEVEERLKVIDSALEELDREESVRVRMANRIRD